MPEIDSSPQALPAIPADRRGGFRPFSTAQWDGWMATDLWADGIEAFIDDEERWFSPDTVVTWYKQHRNRLAEIRWPATAEGAQRTVVLKAYGTRTLLDRARTGFKAPRAARHWDTAWELLERGVNTPLPQFIALPRAGGQLALLGVQPAPPHERARNLLKKLLDGEEILHLGQTRLSPEIFATRCGEYVRQVHEAGVLHRDLSGGNLLIPESWSGDGDGLIEQFLLIDINRVRFVDPARITINQRLQDLERLTFPESLLETYFLAYAGQSADIAAELPRFLKYRKAYRRIRDEPSSTRRATLKLFTYWTRTG